MLRHTSHPSLCLFHARVESHILDSERVGNELASISGEFRTHSDVNHALGKLWDMLAHAASLANAPQPWRTSPRFFSPRSNPFASNPAA